jgi:hypothetical protein
MPTHQFSSSKDSLFIKRKIAEKHRLLYAPRVWLVHQRDTTPLNLYGEQGEISASVEGTDGATSVAASRQFNSAGSDFVTAGVAQTDILEISNPPGDSPTSTDQDNGRYSILSVAATQLVIDRDWPQGGLDSLQFKVHTLNQRYVAHDQPIPFMIKLNPTEKSLDRWGLSEKRDAMVELSVHLFSEYGVTPKIGDRFIYEYGEPSSGASARKIHYEIKNLFESDQISDSGEPLVYIGFASRTTNRLPAL